MDIRLLGPIRVEHAGTGHAIARRRARAVLALLSTTPGRPVPFDRVLEELWSFEPCGNARNAMQAAVTRLRKALTEVAGTPGDAVVRTTDQAYLLDLPTEAVDAHRFLALADRGGALVANHPDAAVPVLTEALRLWSGPALADVGDALVFRVEAAHLDERRLTAREDLMAARLAVGGGSDLVGELRLLTAEHPERERFAEQMMVALHRCGRQTEALDVFHAVRRRLADDHGLAPGRGMRETYQAILSDSVLG